MANPRRFTRAQVAARKSKREPVFIIDGLVYDVTALLDVHPGGREVLVGAAGTDAGRSFRDVAHGPEAQELMKKYVVGEVIHDEPARESREPVRERSAESFVSSWKFSLVVALVLTAIHIYTFGL